MAAAAKAKGKRSVDLWSLCVWVYRDQKAHVHLRRPMDWFLWMIAELDAEGGERRTVHPDAMVVHGLVRTLPATQGSAIIRAAAMGSRPELPNDTLPQVVRPEVDRQADRWEWQVIDGRRTDVKLSVAERHFEGEPADVLYCPITWWPDLCWIEAEVAAYNEWRSAMNALAASLHGATLRDTVLIGWDAGPEAVGPEIVLRDARSVSAPATASPDCSVSLREVETVTNGSAYRRHARAVMMGA